MKLAIVGATGMVGTAILKVLEERNFIPDKLIPVASDTSAGKKVAFNGQEHSVITIKEALKKKPDIAIFSAGKNASLEYAPLFAKIKTRVVDNSSAWRMYEDIKLIVPEVNISTLEENDYIIANPNCSTIPLTVILWPLHLKYKLKRVVVSTYQSVTGSGFKGYNQLMTERSGKKAENPVYPHTIDLNCIPHGGNFLENDYTDEEMKLINETRKILNIHDLKITCTVVRVPVLGGHSESVNVEFFKKPDINEVKEIISSTMGVIVLDNPSKNEYPTPLLAQNRNETFAGRIRIDESNEKAINFWLSADNLRKGAATNAVQIAEYISDNFID